MLVSLLVVLRVFPVSASQIVHQYLYLWNDAVFGGGFQVVFGFFNFSFFSCQSEIVSHQ